MASAPTDGISQRVQESLKDSPYACTSLVKLSGGTANFVYRGTLATPLEDGAVTIVIKHSEAYLASGRDFKLPIDRCDYEQIILTALHDLASVIHEGITVQTPKVYLFSPETHTQIYTDLPSSLDLKNYVLTHTHSLTKSQCARLGHSLGAWAKGFHSWAQSPEQEKLKEHMRANKDMMELKYTMNYGSILMDTISKFPQILEVSRGVFEEVAKSVRGELDGNGGVLIHGDFWSGNVLLPDILIPGPEIPTKLFIIDWELSHVDSLAQDLGQMFAELFELKHFKNIDAGVWLIESFMEGYGSIDEETAFKAVVHVGLHLIVWGSRVQGWGTKEQVEGVVGIGRGFVVHGWKRDRGFFEGGVLGCLFT